MYYGLTFSSDNESLQVVMDTAGLRIYARATSGGVFGEWQFVCGAEGGAAGGSGSGGNVVTAERAEVALRAYQLASPMTITFTGDVTGEVTFDGSVNVVSQLTSKSGSGGGVVEGVEDTVRRMLVEELGTGKEPYRLIEQALKDSLNEHVSEWHVRS